MLRDGSDATGADGWTRPSISSTPVWRAGGGVFGEFDVALRTAPRLPLTGVGLSVLALAALMAVFGMPPVDLHGPLHRFGVMDPLCGMTRGTVSVMRGSIAAAWRYNPASLLVLPAAAALLVRGLVGRSTGRWLVVHWRLYPAGWAVAAALVGLLWANQQAHAAILLR